MYGVEIRKRALGLVLKEKMKRVKVAHLFSIDRKTLFNWELAYLKEGRIKPKKRNNAKSRSKLDPIEFKEFINQHRDWTILQMANKLKVGRQAIKTAIKAIGYTRKKNSISSKSEMKVSANSLWRK